MRLFLIFHILFYFVFLSGEPHAIAADSHTINNGASKCIDEHGVHRNITNSCGSKILAPTKYSGEWTGFINNGPSCATRNVGCPPIHGGWSSWVNGGTFQQGLYTAGAAATIQTRTCTNPAPKYGGNNCSGSSTRTRPGCYAYTLQRVGGSDSVGARFGAPAGNHVFHSTSGTRTGTACVSGSSGVINLQKNNSCNKETRFTINGKVYKFVNGDCGTVFLNTWYRRDFTVTP